MRNFPEDQTIQEILRRLGDLERAARLPSSSIGRDGMTIKDGGKLTFLNTLGNVLFTIDENGLITFETDGSQLSVLDGSKLRYNRANGSRQLEITPAGGLKIYDTDGITPRVVLDATGLDVDGGNVVATYTDVKEGSAGGLTLTDTLTELANVSFTLPAWVETAKVLAVGYVQATNPGGEVPHTIHASTRINDVDDGGASSGIAENAIAQAIHLDESTIDTSVSGHTVQISIYGYHSDAGDTMVASAGVWGIIAGYAT